MKRGIDVMPEIGDRKRRYPAGVKKYDQLVWMACADCGKERWITAYKPPVRCQVCSNRNRVKHYCVNTVPPKLGEIRRGGEIGYTGDKSLKYIWQACTGCGMERWVRLLKGEPLYYRCRECVETRFTSDGRCHKDSSGYVLVYVLPNDFFFPMAKGKTKHGGRVAEHRLTMAKHFNRCLLPWEVVHHRNGIKDDNRLENLQLLPTSVQHMPDTSIKAYVKRLEKKIKYLEGKLSEAEPNKAHNL